MKEHQQMARPMDTVVLSISPVKGISASLRGALGRLGIKRQVYIIEDSSSLRSEKAQMTERLPDNMKVRLQKPHRTAAPSVNSLLNVEEQFLFTDGEMKSTLC